MKTLILLLTIIFSTSAYPATFYLGLGGGSESNYDRGEQTRGFAGVEMWNRKLEFFHASALIATDDELGLNTLTWNYVYNVKNLFIAKIGAGVTDNWKHHSGRENPVYQASIKWIVLPNVYMNFKYINGDNFYADVAGITWEF